MHKTHYRWPEDFMPIYTLPCLEDKKSGNISGMPEADFDYAKQGYQMYVDQNPYLNKGIDEAYQQHKQKLMQEYPNHFIVPNEDRTAFMIIPKPKELLTNEQKRQ